MPEDKASALTKINKYFAKKPLREEDIYIGEALMADTMLTAHNTKFGKKTLEKFVLDAQNGVPMSDMHKRALSFGNTYDGYLKGKDAFAKYYVLRNVNLGQGSSFANTDDLIKAIEGGGTNAVSVWHGTPNTYKCNICGLDIREMDCPHIPGVSYNKEGDRSIVEKDGYEKCFALVDDPNITLNHLSFVDVGAVKRAKIKYTIDNNEVNEKEVWEKFKTDGKTDYFEFNTFGIEIKSKEKEMEVDYQKKINGLEELITDLMEKQEKLSATIDTALNKLEKERAELLQKLAENSKQEVKEVEQEKEIENSKKIWLITQQAKWTTEYINKLPDMAFAVVNGENRALPHHNENVKSPNEKSSVDEPHLRNAVQRFPQVDWSKYTAAQKKKAASHLAMHIDQHKEDESAYKILTDELSTEIENIYKIANEPEPKEEVKTDNEFAKKLSEKYKTELLELGVKAKGERFDIDILRDTIDYLMEKQDLEALQKLEAEFKQEVNTKFPVGQQTAITQETTKSYSVPDTAFKIKNK